MREYSLYLPLNKGLRPYGQGKNSEFLSACHNMRVYKNDLRPYVPVVDPIDYPTPRGVWADNWPFPQIYVGYKRNLGFVSSGMHSMDSEFTPSLVKVSSGGATKWTIADYFDYMVVCDGSAVYERDVDSELWTESSFGASCVCDYKGQLILGGQTDRPENSVSWSKIGHSDLTLDHMNVSGWMPMKWNGRVWDVRRLGEHILVSGSGGVSALSLVADRGGFKLTELAKYGLLGRHAVGGGGDDRSPCLVVSEFGELWMIGPDLSIDNLGYSEFFSAMSDQTLVTYSSHEKCFFISDGVTSYMLSQYGLSSIHQCLTGVNHYGSLVSGVIDTSRDYLYVETEPLDLGLRAIKSLQCVELDVLGGEFSLTLRVNSNLEGVDFELEDQPVNPMGVCSTKVSGLTFQFGVRNETYTDKTVGGLMLRYKLTDKRFLRGPYADQTAPGPNR